jgi:Rrf2 family transcriptional regulator, nitric oxide-sensitive transcriptional repressor
LQLGRPADAIHVGSVIRAAEPDMPLAPCSECIIQPACGLTGVLDQAIAAFMAVLDAHTVADLVGRRDTLVELLGRPSVGGASTSCREERGV